MHVWIAKSVSLPQDPLARETALMPGYRSTQRTEFFAQSMVSPQTKDCACNQKPSYLAENSNDAELMQ